MPRRCVADAHERRCADDERDAMSELMPRDDDDAEICRRGHMR